MKVNRRNFFKSFGAAGLLLPSARAHSVIIDPYRFGFDPMTVPGAAAWWEADDNVTPSSNGSLVTSLVDKISGLTATASGAGRPTLATNAVNGHNTLTTTASVALATGSMAPLFSGTANMAAVVFKTTSAALQFLFYQPGSGTTQALLTSNNIAYFQIDAVNCPPIWGSGVAASSYNCLIFVRNGSVFELWLNGYKLAHVTATGTPAGSNPFNLFSAGSLGVIGGCAALFIANSYSAANVANLWTYFRDKYGITVNASSKYFIMDGASNAYGYGASTLTGTKSASTVALAALGIPGWIGANFGISSQRVTTMITNSPGKVGPRIVPGRTVWVFGDGIANDISAGDSAATIQANLWTLCDTIRALSGAPKIVVCTQTPFGSDSGFEAKRVAVNATTRSGWASHADAIVDHALDTTMFPTDTQADCNHATSPGSTYFIADNVHWSDAGLARCGSTIATQVAAVLP